MSRVNPRHFEALFLSDFRANRADLNDFVFQKLGGNYKDAFQEPTSVPPGQEMAD